METIVSKILFLDRDYQPVGTRIIHRPGIMVHTDRTDSKKIMAVGLGAFDDGEFESVPYHWVAYEGDIKDFQDMHLEFNHGNPIEEALAKHFRFISLREVATKVKRIKTLLGFIEAYRDDEFLVGNDSCWIKENQTVVSLIEANENKFSLCDFLCSLYKTMDECHEGIEYTRKRIKEEQINLRHLEEASSIFKSNIVLGKVMVGDDCIDYRELLKLMVRPALTNQALKIHTLKKRMKELERKRSYIHMVMRFIMTQVWQA